VQVGDLVRVQTAIDIRDAYSKYWGGGYLHGIVLRLDEYAVTNKLEPHITVYHSSGECEAWPIRCLTIISKILK
jgi:hypothetical protein